MAEVVVEAVRRRLELLTLVEVCALLCVTRSWVYDEVEAGRMPYVRLGRQLRFRAADIDEWLDQRAGDSASADGAPDIRKRRRGRPRKSR